MDPFLEGHLWPDVHHRLATQISRQLMPQLRPRYVSRIESYLVEDKQSEAEIGILYPDVEIVTTPIWPFAPTQSTGSTITQPLPAPLTLPLYESLLVRIPTVQIRDAAQNELIAVVEILSPVNKREPGLSKYRQKRSRLHRGHVHIIEIDLLRRGDRPVQHPRLPQIPYLVTLTRAGQATIDVWPISLNMPLPTIPIPLRHPDSDISLNLQFALNTIYEEAAYDLSVNYHTAPPPPPFTNEEQVWWQEKPK